MFGKLLIAVCLICLSTPCQSVFINCDNSTLREQALRNFTIFDRLVTAWNACNNTLPPILVYDHYLANNIRDTYLAFVDKTGIQELDVLKSINDLLYKLNAVNFPKDLITKIKAASKHVEDTWNVSDDIMNSFEELQRDYLKIYNDNVFSYYELQDLLVKKKNQYKDALSALS